MADSKRRRLENAVAAMQQRHGPQALRKGGELAPAVTIPHIATGFSALDAMTGCQGVPLGALTLLSGRTTSGKLTLAYKVLAGAQRGAHGVAYAAALVDLNRTADPDYLARCGVDLGHLLVARPPAGRQAVDVLGDLLQTRGVRAVVVDNLADLAADAAALGRLHASLGRFQQILRTHGCALLMLDDPSPPWLRWLNLDRSSRVREYAALHIEMQRESWLREGGDLVGYRAQACLLKSRWAYGAHRAKVEIVFNGTVQARETW